MVAIDDIDIRIIQILDKLNFKEEFSVYKLTRKLFPELIKDYAIRSKVVFVTYRLKKLCEYGIIELDKQNGITYYSLIADRAYVDHLRIGNRFQKSCYVCINSKWHVYPLPQP